MRESTADNLLEQVGGKTDAAATEAAAADAKCQCNRRVVCLLFGLAALLFTAGVLIRQSGLANPGSSSSGSAATNRTGAPCSWASKEEYDLPMAYECERPPSFTAARCGPQSIAARGLTQD